MHFEQLFMIFITYSVIGWLWETFYCSIKAKHFVYRGFLLGPYCPVYGFGVSFVLLLVPKGHISLFYLYIYTVIIVTIIEYITSWLLEKLFDMQLWNYANIPLNIQGRVALPVSLFWGIGCLFLIKVINPVIEQGIHYFMQMTYGWGVWILFILFISDVATTLFFTQTTKKEVAARVDTSDPNNAAIKEYRLKHLVTNHEPDHNRQMVLNYLDSVHKKLKHRSLSRIVKNYPNLKFKIKK